MIRTPPENTDAEIEAFADLIDRLAGFGAQMTPEMADGFLTAVVAARQTVTPEAWLPALLGDAFERAFADPQAHDEGLAILQTRLRVIAGQLDPEALLEWPDDLRLSPLVYEYGEEDIQQVIEADELPADEARTVLQLGFNWAAGFFAAVEAFPEAWPEPDAEPAEDDTDAQVYAQGMAQLMLLTLPPAEFEAAARELYPDELPSRQQLLDDMCFAVQDLRVHGLDHAPKVATVRHEAPKTGRNDLCPCGSGKKFKKCHGA